MNYQDLGPVNDARADYPDFAHKVAKKVKMNKVNRGILICGSGIGMNIVANKYKNIRAAQCFNLKSTKLSRLHNDANIITFCLLYTSPSPRDRQKSRMPSSA